MWYVIQVRAGTEEKIQKQCDKLLLTAAIERCFIPYYEQRMKIAGEWRTLQKVLFPGYIFVISDQVDDLFFDLKHISGLSKLVKVGDEIVPLTQEEVNLLLQLGGEEQIVQMSEGIIEGSQIRVLHGPLQGMEGNIRKIDRHKRKAWVEIEMFQRKQVVQMGLEVVAKV